MSSNLSSSNPSYTSPYQGVGWAKPGVLSGVAPAKTEALLEAKTGGVLSSSSRIQTLFLRHSGLDPESRQENKQKHFSFYYSVWIPNVGCFAPA